MIYEIRNYYFEPTRLADYRRWVEDRALDFLRSNLEVVGFWITGAAEGEVRGKPMDELGNANVTWIIRWPDLATRHETLPALLASDEWKAIFLDGHPGREHYHRSEIKFAEAL